MRVTRASARQSAVSEEIVESHLCRRTSLLSTRSKSEKGVKPQNVHKTPTKQKAVPSDLHQLSPVTPPKQLKQESEKSALTPSTLFRTLTLTSPHKNESQKPLKRPLFVQKSSKDSCEEENFAVKEEDVKTTLNYQNARRALHSNFPNDMPGREKEIAEIKEFIRGHIEEKSSGSIYISGPPGTGKTASLNLILESEYVLSQVHKIYINCTAIKSATAVYSRLNKELHVKETRKSEKDNLSTFENYLKKKHKPILIVLDEIDQLETKNHSILYTIFEWPSRLNSKLILIGIANALDLTDRMLPRLQARCELKPQLLHFAPYSKEQIVNIFTSRLKTAGVLEVFSPIAIQMLAAKVASVSGDVRRALDIGRRVIELVDGNKGDIFKSMENFTNELARDEAAKKVNLKEIVSVLNNVYGTSQNLTDDGEDIIPLQQKIVVCSLLLMLKKAKNKDITVGKLHEIYSRVCSKRNLSAVDQAEFVGLCSLIETRGIIRLSGKKEPRQHKVVLEWNEKEVSEALKDKQLMSSILQDDACVDRK
ncbi:cell division control protein 6 homolog [Euwallacea fornicatus]|uniref:cell division control protein 6 homolog n=1 Tax=Euwallacea fornicatus TaxID=995702 RepID=UPI00339071AA